MFDVVAFTETWLGDVYRSSDLFPEEYVVLRADRKYLPGSVERGCGMLLAVNRSIQVVHRFDLESTNECIWVEIRQKGRSPLLIGNHYFPGGSKYCKVVSKLSYYFPAGDYVGLRNQFQAERFSIDDFNNIDDAAERLTTILNNCMLDNIPLRRPKLRSFPSWFSRGLIAALLDKQKAHACYKKYGLSIYHDEFCRLRRKAKGLLKRDSRRHGVVVESDLRYQPKKFWKYNQL